MVPLSMTNTGDLVSIKKITGSDEIRKHLADLGFVMDEKVRIVSEAGGNLIIDVKGSRVAFDRSMANHIMV